MRASEETVNFIGQGVARATVSARQLLISAEPTLFARPTLKGVVWEQDYRIVSYILLYDVVV